MCGIAGFLSRRDVTWDDCIIAMTDRLTHRGPDDAGRWVDPRARIALGHRRLSILDLSSQGHQPMVSPSGRYVITYNGEVYNYAELRCQLTERRDGAAMFRGHSDTEVILAAIERWGVSEAVARFAGMFAFALWDREERELYLVRDRLGEKPLYYGWMRDVFLFGSELKALRAHPAWQGEVDRVALDALLRFDFIPAPLSIYRGIRKLIPGSILTVRIDDMDPQPEAYWSPKETFERASAHPYIGSVDEATSCLDQLLGGAVQGQMASDVPLGAFLSGGIDSTAITAIMQARSSRPVRTFTIGFTDMADEAVHAKAVAAYLGTDHTELYITSDDALRVIPELPRIYDEPFADSSQIATFLVCDLASRHVTVALSGDGGDELFAGYAYYPAHARSFQRMRAVPLPLRRAAAAVVGALQVPPVWSLVEALAPALPTRASRWEARHGIGNLARRLGSADAAMAYQLACSRWNRSPSLVADLDTGLQTRTAPARWARLGRVEEILMFHDLIGYLPDDILVKVERASMAVSLEARAPFLDHRVVEFVAALPLEFKLRDGRSKWLLRRVLERYVPGRLVERPKQGFGIPIAQWLRGPLREWAESLLEERLIASDGFLRAPMVRRMWHEHLNGSSYWTGVLWSTLMFQAWRRSEAH
jgi:asparagine synthase (glutamine-hydrolysing)